MKLSWSALRVDEDKGYIDLSEHRVLPEDVAACEDRFNKANAIHGVLRHLAERRKLYSQDLYKTIGWSMDQLLALENEEVDRDEPEED